MITARTRRKRRPNFSLELQQVIPSEYEECKAFYAYTQRILRLGKKVIKHCNEGQRTSWYGKALVAIGLTPGVCDYQYIVSNGKYHSLWIEMKRRDGRDKKTNPTQDEFIELLKDNGHYACYAYGFDHAIEIYKDYVENKL
jgi:hypothetical protein